MLRLARSGAFALVLGLLGAGGLAPAQAAGTSGGLGAGVVSGPKADDESLTYDGFNGFNCSQGGFFTSATGHLNINGPVTVEGKSFLNGALFDTYSLDLGTGPATFPTSFDRTFSSPAPPNSTYKFTFDSNVKRGNHVLGTSITTITCNAGAFAAVNAFVTTQAVPAGHPATWAALALLLGALAGMTLARRRA